MPARRPKPYHHGNLRESLLDAAEEALSDLPLDKVSLREIARRAGVSHAAPGHHFGSLGMLLGDVAARGFERFVMSLDAAARRAGSSAPIRLEAMMRAYLRFAQRNPAVYGLMFGRRGNVESTPHLVDAMRAAWLQLENQVKDVVGDARRLGSATTVWSAVHGLAMLRLDRKMPQHIDGDAASESLIRLVSAGLQTDLGS